MKISREENRLVIKLMDEGKKDKFFYGVSGIPFHKWNDKDTVEYDTTVFQPLTVAQHLRAIKNAASGWGVEITSEAEELFAEYALVLKQHYEAERIKKEKQAIKERANFRVKSGCGWCPELKWDKSRPFCEYCAELCAVDEEEVERLFEEWKITKTYNRPTPFPAKGCKYLKEARGTINDKEFLEDLKYGIQ